MLVVSWFWEGSQQKLSRSLRSQVSADQLDLQRLTIKGWMEGWMNGGVDGWREGEDELKEKSKPQLRQSFFFVYFS